MADRSNITPSDEFLSEIPEYDAFISYKHGAVDSAAARALQKNLEHFRAPLLSGIGLPGMSSHEKADRPKKTGRIRRVFLDDGELSACAAFGSHIREALKKSRWLIIICSPETKRSPWVNLEIETFLEYHDRDHILAVMTSGEPADIFPDAFVGSGSMPDEMLAADARGETVRDVLKKLRGDALLRIAAPILGLNYDDLKQRHRIYELQRIAAAAIVCLAAVTCFSMYALSKNRQLEKSNADLWLRQAEITSKEAQDLLDQGDNLQAVQNLLSVLPDESQKAAGERPDILLPSAQYLLAQALNLYKPTLTPNFGEYMLAACAVVSTDSYLNEDLLSSPNGSHLLAMSGDNVIVWDSETCGRVCEIQFPEMIENWSGEAVLDNNRIVLCGGHTAACFDYTTGEQLWKTTVLNTVCAAVYVSGSGSDADNSTDSSSSGSTDVKNSSSGDESCSDAKNRTDSGGDTGNMRPTDAAVEKPDRIFILTSGGVCVLDAKDGALFSECKYVLKSNQDTDREHIPGNDSAGQKEQISGSPKNSSPADSLQDLRTGTAAQSDDEFIPESSTESEGNLGSEDSPGNEGSPDSESSSDSEKKSLIGSPVKAVLSSGGRFLIFSSKVEQGYEKYLFACDPETGETLQIDSEPFSEVYDIQSETSPDGRGDTVYYAGIRSNTDLEPVYVLRAVTLSSPIRCKAKWSNEYHRSSMAANGDTSYASISAEKSVKILPGFKPEESSPLLLFCCYTHIFMLDSFDGSELSNQELPANMTGFLPPADRKKYFIPITSQGKLYVFDGQSLDCITNAFPAYCSDIAKMTGKNIFFCLLDQRKIIKYAPMETDNRYSSLSMASNGDNTRMAFHADPLFYNRDWLVSEDSDHIFWVRDNETIIHSMSKTQIIKTARTEIPGFPETKEEDSYSKFLLSYYLKPLYLEGDNLHFIDIAERKTSDAETDHVYFKYMLNLSDSSLTSEALFISDENFPSKEKVHFDQNKHILYILQPEQEYTRIWSYTMNRKNISWYDFPQGNINCSRISPDGQKMLLISEKDLKLYVIDLDSKKTRTSISLSEYTRHSINLLSNSNSYSMHCWNGNILAVNDFMRIHIYDKSGTEIRTIPCGKSVVDSSDYTYPLLSLSPDGKYLYYFDLGRLCQYDISEGKVINEIEPSPDSTPEKGPWLCMFGEDNPEKKEVPRSSNTLHILINRVLYTVQCDENSFGLTSRVENVINYNPLTGKIYLSVFNSDKYIYDLLYYREYSLEEIIRFAKERYDIDGQESADPTE